VEALGQHVDQEAPDELVRVEPHGLPAVRAVDAIVLPAERNRAVVGRNEAAVRDGDPMGIAGEIAQHLLRSTNSTGSQNLSPKMRGMSRQRSNKETRRNELDRSEAAISA
jgi:hypothetical protein